VCWKRGLDSRGERENVLGNRDESAAKRRGLYFEKKERGLENGLVKV
jgi:hypothetical protein